MKKETNKHKKSESTIGKIIYGFLLFMPLIAIGTSILVNTFNIQAKEEQSVKIKYKYETNEVNSEEDLIEGNIYHFELNTSQIFDQTFFSATYIKNYSLYNGDTLDLTNTVNYTDVKTTSNGVITLTIKNKSTEMSQYTIGLTSTKQYNIEFVYYKNFNNTYIQYVSKCENIPIESVEIEDKNTSDVFYYSTEKVEQSDLFNWATNSGIYTGISETCNTLSITNTFIPLLLTYWLIISVIYFLYDIILMLINILHCKIHNLQDDLSD